MALKLVGGLSFALIYKFYYGYGDTFTYFTSAQILGQIIIDEPIYGLKLVLNITDYVRAEDYLYNHILVNYFNGADTFTVIKIAGLLSILGAGLFLPTTLFFSIFAFLGQWKLYLTFVRRYPHLKFELALAHFAIPSVIFWGSGVMKDSLVLGFFGFLVYYIDMVLFQRKYKTIYVAYILATTYLIYLIKGYVIIAFLPAFLSWIFFAFNAKIKNVVIRVFIFPSLIVGLSVASFYSYFLIENYDEKYSSENLLNRAYIYQVNHYSENDIEGTRSGYTFGQYEKTLPGMATLILPSINVTLFRPYPWEIKNAVMGITSMESLFISLFSLFVIFRIKFRRLMRYLGSDSFLIMSIVFTLVFSFIVGFSSYNFGALARYKILCLPFYISTLLILTKEDQIRESLKQFPSRNTQR
ncbi:MAG: hypothetical protein CL840_22085 [Crocinitomicaceae bacterium]|nr:hypothetical protein [Crocinitomicaceae bacterium]